MDHDYRSLKVSASNEELVVLAIRIVCLGLLGYWSLILITPFLTIIVWSVIIAVALHPIFDWLSAKLYGHRAVAAVAITVFSLLVMLAPMTWLGLSLAESARMLIARFGDGSLVLPAPPEAVKGWPLLGENVYEMWQLASTNARTLLPRFPTLAAAKTGTMPAHQGLGSEGRDGTEDSWEPAIQLDEE